MKKIVSVILTAMFIFVGCTPANNNNSDGKISVIATIFPAYDFTRAITGDLADLTMFLPPASESHSYEPSPQDIIKIENCDLFIYNGGESDIWVDNILSAIDTGKTRILKMIDCAELAEEEIVEGMETDEQNEDTEYDEHVWTSPRNAKLITGKISDALCEIDKENADVYKSNTVSYLAQLDSLGLKFQEIVANAERRTIIFGDRFPFLYFARDYKLDYYAAFPGCSAETEANAKTVTFLIGKIKEEEIPVIFHIELSNERIAQSIGEQTGAAVRLLHSCHNITKTEFDSGVTYLDLMNMNVEVLKEALS